MSSIWFSHDVAQHRNLSGQRPMAGGPPGRRAVVCEGALWLISGVAVQPIAQPDGHWLGKAPPSRRRRPMHEHRPAMHGSMPGGRIAIAKETMLGGAPFRLEVGKPFLSDLHLAPVVAAKAAATGI